MQRLKVPFAAKPPQLRLLCHTALPCSVQDYIPANSLLVQPFDPPVHFKLCFTAWWDWKQPWSTALLLLSQQDTEMCSSGSGETLLTFRGSWIFPGIALRGLGNGLTACVVTRALLMDGESCCFQQRTNARFVRLGTLIREKSIPSSPPSPTFSWQISNVSHYFGFLLHVPKQ